MHIIMSSKQVKHRLLVRWYPKPQCNTVIERRAGNLERCLFAIIYLPYEDRAERNDTLCDIGSAAWPLDQSVSQYTGQYDT